MRYHARWVLPVSSAPIEHGTVVEESGIITFVGPRADAPLGADHELGEALLLPGLVNAHTHLELTAMRGFLENLCFTDWISTLRRSRNDVLSPEMLLDSARQGIVEGITAGVTTFADTCSSGVALQAMKEMGVRGVMYQEVFGPDPATAVPAMAALRASIDAQRLRCDDLVSLGVSPHAPYTVSDELYRAASEFAQSEQLPLAMHIAESAEEHALVAEGAGPFGDGLRKRGIAVAARARSPIALLETTGALSANSLLIHCVNVDDADIAIIAERGCSIAHCPASNAKFGHGIAPLLPLLAAGIKVGIGSDSVASNNRMDILDEARLALLIHRAVSKTHDAFDARGALELATVGGARALGLDKKIGTLEVGKQADLSAFSLSDARTAPVGDPESAAVFAVAGRPAILTVVRGKVLLRNGRPVSPDDGLQKRVLDAARSLAGWSRGVAVA